IRVDVDSADDPRAAEAHDAPVVPAVAPPPRFPSVHPFAPVGVLVGDKYPSPALRRFSFGAKNSSLTERTDPPIRSEARSTDPGNAADSGAVVMRKFENCDRGLSHGERRRFFPRRTRAVLADRSCGLCRKVSVLRRG